MGEQIRGTMAALKFIIDTLERRHDCRPDTVVTITQELVNGSERHIASADPKGFDPSISVGFKVDE